MSLYEWLVLTHIVSAIIGMGPGFVLTRVTKSATTLPELRHGYTIKRQLHYFVMAGGTLLLITGLWMGAINPPLFQQGWYVISLSLYLIALAMGPTVLKWYSKPVKQLLEQATGEQITEEYHRLANKLYRVEYFENTLFIVIIILMITKPF
ncbi:putative membrane protein [Alkalibacillus flavidus]|uniref:Membrane protein n=1 Tax=Alkalibacillus flavidus TaxID=546021 RepID=A0ABV2KUE2_9BACI